MNRGDENKSTKVQAGMWDMDKNKYETTLNSQILLCSTLTEAGVSSMSFDSGEIRNIDCNLLLIHFDFKF